MSKQPQPMTATTLPERLEKIRAAIAQATAQAGRQTNSVQLLAASKQQTASAIRSAFACGQHAFGENYLQEALAKQQALQDLAIEWHFIGPIQSNKTGDIASHFSWVHSVDRPKVAQRLSRQRPAHMPPLNICLQVNIDREATKAGVTLDALETLAMEVSSLPHLHLRGLMAIPAPREDAQQQLASFQRLQQAATALKDKIDTIDTLSMGMSADMTTAIAAGSTIVRIGSALFGPRPT